MPRKLKEVWCILKHGGHDLKVHMGDTPNEFYYECGRCRKQYDI